MGIEPTYLAWKASVLPLNYTRIYAETVMLLQQSGWQDSNLRPPGPKPGALAKLSHTPMFTTSFLWSCHSSISQEFVFSRSRQELLYYMAFHLSTPFLHFFIFFSKNRTTPGNPHKIRAGGISAASIFPFLDLVFPIFPKISSKNFSEFFIPLHLPSGQIRR